MKFEEALAAMREGKRVRREGWLKSRRGLWFRFDRGGRPHLYAGKHRQAEHYDAITVAELVADDWQIVDAEKEGKG